MMETPQQAARRLARSVIQGEFKPEALHTYTDEKGEALYWRIRARLPNGEKWIRPMRRNGNGCELGEPDYPNGKPLYRLHELAAKPGAPCWYVEGENCADALALLVLATTAGGATSDEQADFAPLAGRTITVWPDHDSPGIEHAERVAVKLRSLGCNVETIDAAALELPEGSDCVDWLKAHPGATAADLAKLPRARRTANAPTGDPSEIAYRCMVDIKAKPIRWLWPSRIARGKVSLIAGHAGLGKSQTTVSFAATVSTGGQWPADRTRCERGDVIILSAEDDAEDTIRPRLEAAGADLSRVYVLDAVRETNGRGEVQARAFNLATDISRLGALLADKLRDVALIVIDPISAYLGGADSHNNAEVRALLAPLAEMAARHGVAVVCVSHLNKSAGSEALLRVQGSIAFGAAARAVWGVARDKDNAARRLFLPLKNNLGNDLTGLAFAVEGYRLPGGIETSRVVWEAAAVTVTVEEAFAPEANREDYTAIEDAKLFLANLLADGPVPALRVKAAADGAGYALATIRRAQKALSVEAVKGGLKEGWTWQLPPKVLKNPEGAQANNVSAFGKNERLRQSEPLAAFDDLGRLRGHSGASAPAASDAEGEVF